MLINEEQMREAGIETVTVNGMTMYKRRDRLHLTPEHAYFGDRNFSDDEVCRVARRWDVNPKCIGVPTAVDNNLFKRLASDGVLHALVKF